MNGKWTPSIVTSNDETIAIGIKNIKKLKEPNFILFQNLKQNM